MELETLAQLAHDAGPLLFVALVGLAGLVWVTRNEQHKAQARTEQRIDEMKEALKEHNSENKDDFKLVHDRISEHGDEMRDGLAKLQKEVHEVHTAVARLEAKEKK